MVPLNLILSGQNALSLKTQCLTTYQHAKLNLRNTNRLHPYYITKIDSNYMVTRLPLFDYDYFGKIISLNVGMQTKPSM
jgi:hypothetical protein